LQIELNTKDSREIIRVMMQEIHRVD